jgi:hypothetical protein
LVGCSSILPKTACGGKKARLRASELQLSPQKNRWVLLRKTIIFQTKQALSRPNLQFCTDLVRFYAEIRTEFERED